MQGVTGHEIGVLMNAIMKETPREPSPRPEGRSNVGWDQNLLTRGTPHPELLNIQPPELWEDVSIVYKPPSLWHFVLGSSIGLRQR